MRNRVLVVFGALLFLACRFSTLYGADVQPKVNGGAKSVSSSTAQNSNTDKDKKPLEFKTYKEAKEEVTQSRAPLLVVITTTWCGPCKRLKNVVLPDLAKRGELNGITLAAVDFQADKEVAKLLTKETKVPQMVLFTPAGDQWKPSHMTGLQSTDKIISFLAEAKASVLVENAAATLENATAAVENGSVNRDTASETAFVDRALTPKGQEPILETESVFGQSPFLAE